MHMFENKIDAHCDFEFYSHDQRQIDYSIIIPDTEIKRLVVYIAGFGADAGSYRNNFQKYICDGHSMACLVVDYHCFFSRISNGASLSIDPNTMKLLRTITGCINNESVDTVLLKAGNMKASSKTPLKVAGLLYPKKNEYQNFGILPALDNLYAINDVFKKYPNIPKKIYAIGSSYGGYIANLISKIAPCTLNAVFDNSSWATPNMKYILGYELGTPEFSIVHSPNVILEVNVLSPWSHLPFMPNSFSKNCQLMRSFPDNHLDVMAQVGKHKTIYRFVHSEKDYISDTKQKISLFNRLKSKGFNVHMEIYSKKDVDGQYIKSMSHGMGLSMRKFFSKCINQWGDDIQDDQIIDFDSEHSFQFECETQKYAIVYSGNSQPICCLSNKS